MTRKVEDDQIKILRRMFTDILVSLFYCLLRVCLEYTIGCTLQRGEMLLHLLRKLWITFNASLFPLTEFIE